ncbi:hypothetical protein ABZX74_15435 [Streptomyces olivaceoviridis]|uniref:hypothetical protein n=1 Tax=Streptomyces olivaceoviridis TaxID=1921 RepID=UPI0033AD1AE2
MTDPTAQPLDLDAIQARAAHLSEYAQQTGEGDQLAGTDVPALVAEIHRLRAELASAREQVIHWAAETTDAKLTAEPDHNRASALYELLLHLRGELPCTCARTGGLHAKDCRKYVPGHELISRDNALARYRVERPAAPVVRSDTD